MNKVTTVDPLNSIVEDGDGNLPVVGVVRHAAAPALSFLVPHTSPAAAARAHGRRAMGPCPCVQEPKLWPMSILTFGPISIFSIPVF